MESFQLHVSREISRLDQNGKRTYLSGFDFEVIGYSNWILMQFSKAMCDQNAWGSDDEVEFKYYDKVQNRFVKVTTDSDLSVMFARNIEAKSVILQNDVVIKTRAHSNCNRSESNSTPSEHVASSQPSSNQNNTCRLVVLAVEDGAPDEFFSCDNDEWMYPDLVGRSNIEPSDEILAQFDEIDDEEKEENNDMSVGRHVDDHDLHMIQYDRDNPSLDEGRLFPSMINCRNALATYYIKGEYDFVIDKSEPNRLTVYYAYRRCRWRMHASPMRNSTIIQVKVNPFSHTCPSAERKASHKVAKSRW
jgi:hypothetical protein